MNAQMMASRAYAAHSTTIRSTRGIEYSVFSRITRKMRDAYLRGSKGFSDLVDALDENRRLWEILAVDVADPENALPQELRAQVFYLAEFTLQHTPKVLQREASAKILIEINASMLKGLRSEGTAK